MRRMIPAITLFLLASLLAGCALLKVITVPVKATTKVVGGTADVID